MILSHILETCAPIIADGLAKASIEDRIDTLNALRKLLHEHSPFRHEPVDCIQWVPAPAVQANDYNPNSVAPPEMVLLQHSIEADGYTQPIVAWATNEHYEVIDGFHRNRIGKECESVRERLQGYLPLAVINTDREDRSDRIAATIRHNRARGKHQVSAMSEIVVELKRRNWSDARIGKELGMEPDEVLRLCQISGLAELFADKEFSEAWEPIDDDDYKAKLDEDGEEVDLEWYSAPLPHDGPMGWHDRTEQSSVLYAISPRVKGSIQKSHVGDHWHWYAFLTPMRSGISDTRELAKRAVDAAWSDYETDIPSLFPMGRIPRGDVAESASD